MNLICVKNGFNIVQKTMLYIAVSRKIAYEIKWILLIIVQTALKS